MPRGYEHIIRLVFTSAFRGIFSLSFLRIRLYWEKRSLRRVCQPRSQGSLLTTLRAGRIGENPGNEVSMFDCLFLEKYTVKDYISTDRAHAPIILFKSN